MARKRGPAPPGHARTHADLSAASPRAACPAPSCREAPGGGRKGARLRGAARGLKHQVRLPPACDPATKALLGYGHPSHGSCDAASLPRASRAPGARPAPARAPPGALGPSHSPTVWSPAPPSLVAPIPLTASRARGAQRGFHGDSNLALLQRTASVETPPAGTPSPHSRAGNS